MDKTSLDQIIEKHKAQPVGHGYIDIIVSRDNYKDFVVDLVNNGFIIESISWWEWCPEEKENEYGLGGLQSQFYNGWFSELSIDVDDIKLKDEMKSENILAEIINRIESKTISFPNETVTFRNHNWLTPAIWLNIPDDWRNKDCT
ncbi:MAG: hypothetical protein ABUL44_05055 [Flavobacterium sp.]